VVLNSDEGHLKESVHKYYVKKSNIPNKKTKINLHNNVGYIISNIPYKKPKLT